MHSKFEYGLLSVSGEALEDMSEFRRVANSERSRSSGTGKLGLHHPGMSGVIQNNLSIPSQKIQH